MGPKILAALGAVVAVASGVWWYLDTREDPLPEGAIAGDSVTITVGDSPGWLLTAPQWGLVAGAILVLAGLVWGLAARRTASDGPSLARQDP